MWKSVLLALVSGLLLYAGWPTLGIPLFLFIGFVPLLIIEKQFTEAPFKQKALRIFGLSFLAFALWNGLSYFWLSSAHPQENATSSQVYQAWFAYGFAVIANALMMAAVFVLFHKIRKKNGNLYGYVFLPAIWMVFEKIHLNWELAWPWMNLGNGFASYYQWVQWYEYTGAFGGTLWVWLGNIFLFLGIMKLLERKPKIEFYQYLIYFLLIVLLPITVSYIIYENYEEQGEEIEVVLLQPDLNPYHEKYEKSSSQVVEELLDLANSEISNTTDFVLAPETAFPGRGEVVKNQAQKDYLIQKIIKWGQKHPQTVFVSGIDLVEFIDESNLENNPTAIESRYGWYNAYNAVVQIENKQPLSFYNKSKFVVGVELFPYQSVLKPLLGDQMLNFGGSIHSLTGQVERAVFKNQKNNGKVAPTVCYESIFGEFVSEFVNNGANVLFISTNDSWWGNSDGHLQLLDYARLRAIENRRSIARSANSGISAFINQKGDIISALSYDTQGAIKGKVKLNEKLTSYTQTGDLLARISLILVGILLAFEIVGRFANLRK